METSTTAPRSQTDDTTGRAGPRTRLDRVLGHPLAFVVTAVLLLALFGGTFVAHPDRTAPTKDPAYYTWRTEALISEDPRALLDIEGAFEMFAGGYRVAVPVIGGFLRHIPGISSLGMTVLLMVVVPVTTALLLAGFAYRGRRDPLIWHSVALGSGGLLLTAPFVGYLDNVLCLMFLAAALPLLRPARDSWAARLGAGVLLLMAGFTHPTTLAIFCLTLGLFAAVRLLVRRFDLRAVVREDGPILAVGLAVAVLTYLIWKIGIWGKSASLSEAALPPPYGSDFFIDRMSRWVTDMRPALNGPLFAIGAVGLAAAGLRAAAEDELARVSILWLAPLAGLFGWLAGLTYPYYRFFNTTLAWVLLVGLGMYFAARFFFDLARRGGVASIALLGVVAVAVVIATNFTTGFERSGWYNPSGGWLATDERRDLDVLRGALAGEDRDRPVVFVIDDRPATFQIWGFTKLAGNTSRYGLPPGQVDRGYLYLGSFGNYLAGEPTSTGDETYDKLSPALLEDADRGVEDSGADPIVVVASIFNRRGANAEIAAGAELPSPSVLRGAEVWILHDGDLTGTSATGSGPSDGGGALHLVWVVAGLALLLLPGVLLVRYVLPDASFAEGLGLAPALAMGWLGLIGIVVLALVRSPFTAGLAWVTFGVAAVAAGMAAVAAARRRHPAPASGP